MNSIYCNREYLRTPKSNFKCKELILIRNLLSITLPNSISASIIRVNIIILLFIHLFIYYGQYNHTCRKPKNKDNINHKIISILYEL